MSDLKPQFSRQYLAPLISRIDHLPQKTGAGPGQTIVVINPSTRETRSGLPTVMGIVLPGAEKWRRFMLTPSASVICDPFNVTLADRRGARRQVECIVTITRLHAGWENILVNAFCIYATPEAALEEHVRGWLQDFVNKTDHEHPDCLRRFAAHRDSAQRHVHTTAGKNVDEAGVATGLGLDLVCAIKLPEDDLKPIELRVRLPRLLCSDYDDPVPSDEEATLEVPHGDTEMESKARSTGLLAEDFQEVFERGTTLWFRQHCSLQRYAFEREEVRKLLREHLSRLVAEHGRVLTFLRVQPVQELSFPQSEEIIAHIATVEIDATRAGAPDQTFKVRVNHKVQIETADAARWLLMQSSQKIGDYREWIKARLQKHTDDTLLGKSYGDIVVEFERLNDDVETVADKAGEGSRPRGDHQSLTTGLKKDMQDAVKRDLGAAGLSVRMFTSTPDLPVRRFLVDGFRVDIKGTEAELPTNDSSVTFKMAISISGTLKSLEPFKRYLTDPEVDIAKHLREEALIAAGDMTRMLSPKQLFLGFDAPLQDGNVWPRKLIADEIKKRVLGKAGPGAECERLHLNPVKDKFDERWADLTPPEGQGFELRVARLDLGDDKLILNVVYSVVEPYESKWAFFLNHCTKYDTSAAQVEAMNRKLRDAATIWLGSEELEKLGDRTPADYHRDRAVIFAEGIAQIAENMGIIIDVTSFVFVGTERSGILQAASRIMFEDRVEQAKAIEKQVIGLEGKPLSADKLEIESVKRTRRNLQENTFALLGPRKDQKSTSDGTENEEQKGSNESKVVDA